MEKQPLQLPLSCWTWSRSQSPWSHLSVPQCCDQGPLRLLHMGWFTSFTIFQVRVYHHPKGTWPPCSSNGGNDFQGYTVILSHSWWSNLAIFHNLAARSSPPWPSPHFGRCHAFAKPEGLHTNWSDSIHGNLRVRHPPPQEIAGLIQDSLRGLWWVHGPLINKPYFWGGGDIRFPLFIASRRVLG